MADANNQPVRIVVLDDVSSIVGKLANNALGILQEHEIQLDSLPHFLLYAHTSRGYKPSIVDEVSIMGYDPYPELGGQNLEEAVGFYLAQGWEQPYIAITTDEAYSAVKGAFNKRGYEVEPVEKAIKS